MLAEPEAAGCNTQALTDRGTAHAHLSARLACSLVSGLTVASAFPPYNLPLFLPFGVAGFVASIKDIGPRHSAYLGFVFGLALYSATLFWLANLFGVASISLIAILASFLLLFGLVFQWLKIRLPMVPPWLLASFVWTGIEYFRSEQFVLSFGWLGLGYGTIGSAAFAWLASCVGSYGVTFVIVALSVGAVYHRRKSLKIVAAIIWVAAWAILFSPEKPARPITVRMVQENSDGADDLFALSKPARQRTDAILWPEYSLNSDPTRDPNLWARLQQVARDNHSVFIFGAKSAVNLADDALFHNTAFVLDAEGSLIGRHFKNHVVHFVKDGLRGAEARALPTALGKLGVAICYDVDYPDVARRLVQDGAEVFLVPNMDPGEWGPVQREQHRLMFRMRAIECGRWLARADVAGGTSVVGPNGVETARVATSDAAVLVAQVGREGRRTYYVRGGWIIGPGCLAILAAILLWATLPAVTVRDRWSRGEASGHKRYKRPAN